MGYEKTSIIKIVQDIESNKMYLPALQRKFVWGKYRIQMLFDSIMRNYPIGTFLFWKLGKEKADNYVFYEFLKEYDQRNPFNRRKTGYFLHPEITGVLDGQQRLSSMYIGLQGTHAEKGYYRRRDDENAYEKTSLYLNLLDLPYFINEKNEIAIDEEKDFDFEFLTSAISKKKASRTVKNIEEDGKENELVQAMYWFKVGEALTWNEDPEFDLILEKCISDAATKVQKESLISQKRFVKKAIETLHNRLRKDLIINYFEVRKEDLEHILKIFIRVNSGGMQLNKTDLLFSTIVATWDNGREEIENLIRNINAKGDGFNFSNEYIMRACLMLTDGPVLYKVDSFKSENVQTIRDEWPNIASAISKTVNLLKEFGFNGSLLASQNATIIIAYYLVKGGIINDEAKKEIKKYLIHSLLNGIYGSSQDQLLIVLRNAFRKEVVSNEGKVIYVLKNNKFSFDKLLKTTLPSKKSLYVSEAEIDNYLTYRKGSASFFVLSLLYPNLRYTEVQFHQDHIHPCSGFNDENFNRFQLTDEEREEWRNLKDMIPNLQLMEGRKNESKNATSFDSWLLNKSKEEQEQFLISNYISKEVDLSFCNFRSFFEERKARLKVELKKVLSIDDAKPTPDAPTVENENIEEIVEEADEINYSGIPVLDNSQSNNMSTVGLI